MLLSDISEGILKDRTLTIFLSELLQLYNKRGLHITNNKELFELFFELSSKKGSKYATEVSNRQKSEIIVEKFENSLDILNTMLMNMIQLKTGARIGMSVSIDLTRETSKLFTDRINKLHYILDKHREILSEKIVEKIGKYFDMVAPSGLLNPEEFLKSDIALNVLKEFIHKYNRASNCFTQISLTIKQLTDILNLEGNYNDPQIIKDKKYLEALLKLMIIISKPRKGIYDFFS
ncbi:MAG: hypothetical protein ACFFG0_57430 [Candidatus Thorarchaeota archaeon]